MGKIFLSVAAALACEEQLTLEARGYLEQRPCSDCRAPAEFLPAAQPQGLWARWRSAARAYRRLRWKNGIRPHWPAFHILHREARDTFPKSTDAEVMSLYEVVHRKRPLLHAGPGFIEVATGRPGIHHRLSQNLSRDDFRLLREAHHRPEKVGELRVHLLGGAIKRSPVVSLEADAVSALKSFARLVDWIESKHLAIIALEFVRVQKSEALRIGNQYFVPHFDEGDLAWVKLLQERFPGREITFTALSGYQRFALTRHSTTWDSGVSFTERP